MESSIKEVGLMGRNMEMESIAQEPKNLLDNGAKANSRKKSSEFLSQTYFINFLCIFILSY